jgi:hypothetical protein
MPYSILGTRVLCGRLQANNGDAGDEAVSRPKEAINAAIPVGLAPPLKVEEEGAR